MENINDTNVPFYQIYSSVCGNANLFFMSGRGFDQETWSEKDEAAICSFNTKCKGDVRKEQAWDIFHPNILGPRANAGVFLLGNSE